jgi:hypothetical protein
VKPQAEPDPGHPVIGLLFAAAGLRLCQAAAAGARGFEGSLRCFDAGALGLLALAASGYAFWYYFHGSRGTGPRCARTVRRQPALESPRPPAALPSQAIVAGALL